MAPGWVKRMLTTNKSEKKKRPPSAQSNILLAHPSMISGSPAKDTRSRSVPPVEHRELAPDAFARSSTQSAPRSPNRGNGVLSPSEEGRAYRWASAAEKVADRPEAGDAGTNSSSLPSHATADRQQHAARGRSTTPRRTKKSSVRGSTPSAPNARDSSPLARKETGKAASGRESVRQEQAPAQQERDLQQRHRQHLARSSSTAQTVPQNFQRGEQVIPDIEIPDQELYHGPPPATVPSSRPPRSPERGLQPTGPARWQQNDGRAKQSKQSGSWAEDAHSQGKSTRTSPSLGEDLVGICDNRQDFLDSPVRPGANRGNNGSSQFETELLARKPPPNSVNLQSGELRILQSGDVQWVNSQAGKADGKSRPDDGTVRGTGPMRPASQPREEPSRTGGQLQKNPRLYESDIFNSINSTRAGLYANLAPLNANTVPAPLNPQIMRTADFPSTPDVGTPGHREREPRRQTPPDSLNSAYASDMAIGYPLPAEPSRPQAFNSDNDISARARWPYNDGPLMREQTKSRLAYISGAELQGYEPPGSRYLDLRDSLDLAGLSMPAYKPNYASKPGLYSDSVVRPGNPGFHPTAPHSDPYGHRQDPKTQRRTRTESYTLVRHVDSFQGDRPRARNPLFDSQVPVRHDGGSSSSSEHQRQTQLADVRAQGPKPQRHSLDGERRGPRVDNLATLYGEMVETRNSEAFAGPYGMDPERRLQLAAVHEDSTLMEPQHDEDLASRRLLFDSPSRQAQEVQELERRMDALRMRLRTTTDSNQGPMPRNVLPPSLVNAASQTEEVQSELEEQRRVVNYLRSELASLEHDLHDTRQQLAAKEEQLAAKEERDSSANDRNSLAAQLAAAQREKQELANLVDELRGSLERTVAEKDAELKGLRADLEEAQEEAAAQEDAAELARGELDEFRRRLQDEVEHARQEALLAARDETTRARELQEEVERLAAAAQRARQERDSLCDMLAAGSRKRTDLDQNILDLEEEVDAQRNTIAILRDVLAQMEAEKAGLEVFQQRHSERQAGSQKEAEELREAIVQLRKENEQLATERAKPKANKAALQKKTSRKRSSPSKLDSSLLFSSSNMETMDLGGADFEGFELGSFDLGEPEASRDSNRTAKEAQLADQVARALQAAQKANEEKAELIAENSELRMKLRGSASAGTQDEMTHLRQVQGLADEALQALEAQTQEVAKLRADAEAAKRALEQRNAELIAARSQPGHLEKASSDRGSEAYKVRGDSAKDIHATSMSDVHSGAFDSRGGEPAHNHSQGLHAGQDIHWNQARAPGALPQVYDNQQIFEQASQAGSLDRMRSELLNTQNELEDLRNAFAASSMNILDSQASMCSGSNRELIGIGQRSPAPKRELHSSNGPTNGVRSGSGQFSLSSLEGKSSSRIPGPAPSYEPRNTRSTSKHMGPQQ